MNAVKEVEVGRSIVRRRPACWCESAIIVRRAPVPTFLTYPSCLTFRIGGRAGARAAGPLDAEVGGVRPLGPIAARERSGLCATRPFVRSDFSMLSCDAARDEREGFSRELGCLYGP